MTDDSPASASPPGRDHSSLEDILEALLDSTEGQDTVETDDLLGAFGSRAFGPLMVAPAALIISPLGAIPALPALLSTVILLVSLQHIVGKRSPWLPRKLRDRAVKRERLERAVRASRPWARRIDRFLTPRLAIVVDPPADRVLAAQAAALAASIYALGFIPFAAMAPASGIALIGLAVATRDGLAAVLSLASTAGAAWIGATMLF